MFPCSFPYFEKLLLASIDRLAYADGKNLVLCIVSNAPHLIKPAIAHVEGVRRIPFVDSALNKPIETNGGGRDETSFPFQIREALSSLGASIYDVRREGGVGGSRNAANLRTNRGLLQKIVRFKTYLRLL